jgi:AcrR family transcriptional regulator
MSVAENLDREESPEGRERLIGAAIRRFGRDGYEGTSVRDIAEEAGVAFSLIRFYFGSKEGLRDAAEERVVRNYLDLLMTAGESVDFAGVARAIDANLAGPLSINDIAPFLRRAMIEDRPIVHAFVRDLLERDRVNLQKEVLDSYPDEDWARDPTIGVAQRLGFLFLAPLFQSLLGRDVYSRDELMTRNARGYRMSELLMKGLAADGAGAGKKTPLRRQS